MFNQWFNETFPNINNLMVGNLTANTAYPKEIVSKTQQTKYLTVTTNMINDKCNTTQTITGNYLSNTSTLGENIVYQNQTIQSYMTSDQLFLFENGQVNFNETLLAQSNMTFHSVVRVDNLTVNGMHTVANTTILGKNVSFNKMTVNNGKLSNATITNTFSLTNGSF